MWDGKIVPVPLPQNVDGKEVNIIEFCPTKSKFGRKTKS